MIGLNNSCFFNNKRILSVMPIIWTLITYYMDTNRLMFCFGCFWGHQLCINGAYVILLRRDYFPLVGTL